MDPVLNGIIRSVIEAITEFLPISSTGHLYLFSSFFPFEDSQFDDLYDVFIQSGAILSVLVLYRKDLIQKWNGAFGFLFYKQKKNFESFEFYLFLFFGCFPILILGFFLKDFLDILKQLESLLLLLGFNWFVGGFLILASEKFYQQNIKKSQKLSIKKSILIGFFQCIALFPGISRSAATIIGARFLGIEKKEAAEYSFFLAVPVLIAASGYKFFKHYSVLDQNKAFVLCLGFFVSFFLCMIVIKMFLKFIQSYSFSIFGYYRILLGILVASFYFVY